MSGHGLQRGDPAPSERKIDSVPMRLQAARMPLQRAELPLKSPSMQEHSVKGSMAGRPIAPAPSLAASSTSNPALMSSLQGPTKVLSLTAGPAKYPAQVISGGVDGLPPSSSALPAHLLPMNIGQQVVNAPIVTQAPQVASMQALSVTGTLTGQPVTPMNISMASLISRTALPHSVAPPVAGLSVTHQQPSLAAVPHANVQTFQSHVPRGAAAASALTAAPKISSVSSAVMRPNQPSKVQIPAAPSTLISPMSAQIRGQVLTSARSASPATSQDHFEPTRRLLNVATSAGVMPSNRDPVQITIHQPRVVVDASTRPIVSPLSTRAVTFGQQSAIIQQAQLGHQPQKVMISNTQPSIASHLQPMANTTIASGKSAVLAGQNPVLNLSQHVRPQRHVAQVATTTSIGHLSTLSGSHPRSQKYLVSAASTHHPASTTSASGAKIGPGGTALNLSQNIRTQKVVMSTASSLQAPKIGKAPPRPLHPDHLSRDPNPHSVRPVGHHPQPAVTIGNPGIATRVTAPLTLAASTAGTDKSSDKVAFTGQFATFSDYPFCSPDLYQNLVFQHLTQQALGTAPSVRPGTLLPSQNPNLAATLQAAGPAAAAVTVTTVLTSGSTGSSAPPAPLRSTPMNLVTVDPARHSVQSQYVNEGARIVAETTQGGMHATAQLSSSSVSQPISSPARPSILRKRPNEGAVTVKRNVLGGALQAVTSLRDSSSPAAEPIIASPSPKSAMLDPNRDVSQSSTDTASSAESTPFGKGSQESEMVNENGHAMNVLAPSTEASPRKKPRKQLLHANEEFIDEEETSSNDEEELKSTLLAFEQAAEEIKKEDLEEYVDEDGVRWVREKKRQAQLLDQYQCNWKTRLNHFQRHTDVKAKGQCCRSAVSIALTEYTDERRPTVNELSNQVGVQQKASGWKVFHMAAQLEDIVDLEREVCSHLAEIQTEIAPISPAIQNAAMEDDISMVHELTQGNVQRCQLLVDQLVEARTCMIKVLDHRSKIRDIISRHHSKRPVKKKERV